MAVISGSRLRTGTAAVAATTVVFLVVAVLGNQGLQGWRGTQADGKNDWVAVIFQTLQYSGWRFTAGHESTEHWLAPLVFNGVFVIATALLAAAAAHNRTRGTVFFGIWGAVTLAGGLAGIASSPLVFSGGLIITNNTTADDYRTSADYGLLLGLLVGVIAALFATLAAGGRGSGQRGAARSQAQAAPVPDTGDTWPLTS